MTTSTNIGRETGAPGGGTLKTLIGIVPLAIVTAGVAGAIWLLLDRGEPIGQWLLAAFLVGHGWIHLMYAMSASTAASRANAGSTSWPFDLAQAWPVTRAGVGVSPMRVVGAALVAVTIVTSTLAALATVGLIVPTEWWGTLVTVAAGSSALLLVLTFSPGLLIGLGVDAFLLWLVYGAGWVPPVG